MKVEYSGRQVTTALSLMRIPDIAHRCPELLKKSGEILEQYIGVDEKNIKCNEHMDDIIKASLCVIAIPNVENLCNGAFCEADNFLTNFFNKPDEQDGKIDTDNSQNNITPVER